MYKFLIIDDDPNSRYIFKHMLKKNFECDVLEAANGQIGLTLLSETVPDMILLDLSMPVMDGFKMLAAIRSDQFYKDIPVLIVTANRDAHSVNNLAPFGISGYLVKPIDPDESVVRIRTLLAKNLEEAQRAANVRAGTILIVDTDSRFKSTLKSAVENRYIVHESTNGVDGLNLYLRYKPKLVFVSDRLNLLDKKIISQKIKENATANDVLIYLLVDDLTKLSTKVFHYNGIIKREFDKDLFLLNNPFLQSTLPEQQAVQR